MGRDGRFAASCDTYESRLDKGGDAQVSAQKQAVNLEHQASRHTQRFPIAFRVYVGDDYGNIMASELEHFTKSFSSEADLRERLATLFSKMPGIQGTRITHGSQEYGKDIIFYSRDAMGDWILNACVVKNEKISGAADGNTSGRNVLVQSEQAPDTPYINSSAEEENVARVYVISPYECPQTTMRSVQGKMRGRSGQVTFLCGRPLLEKFARHWPEFVAFETTLLGSYIARLQRTFDDTDPITFLMTQHQILSAGGKGLAKVYVRQRFRKSLQEFQLTARIQPPALQLSSSEETIADFAQQLTSVASLLRHPEAWDKAQGQDAEPTSAELLSLAESLRASWRAEYERFRSERQRRGDRVPARHSVQLPLQIDPQPMKALIDRAQTALTALGERLDEANKFAKGCTNIIERLGSPAHLSYCATNQIVQLAPAAFRATWAARDQFMPEDLLDKTKVALLVAGPAGYGKTSFCKWNFLNDVKLLSESTSEVIPVYVPLHQLATISVTGIEEVFLRSDDVRRLVQSAKDQSRPVRFYLDGLDEVSTLDQQRKLMELASLIPTEIPTAQVIVTGRDYVTGHWLGWLARVNLAELTDAQVKEFITNWLGDDPEELQKFNAELDKSRTLLPLMRVPLLATLIVAVFRRMQSLPENKVSLYDIFVDLMCGGWDVAKNVRRDTKFGSNAKLSILTRLAGHLHINERRGAEESDIRSVIKESLPAVYDDWRNLLAELLEDGLLVRLAGGVGFAHLSFQEYLAAKDLTTDPSGERQKLVLRRFLRGEDWWREVLAFYLSMTQRPDEVVGWIKSCGLKISRDLKSQDMGKRWEFMMKSLQDAAPGWTPPDPGPLVRA